MRRWVSEKSLRSDRATDLTISGFYVESKVFFILLRSSRNSLIPKVGMRLLAYLAVKNVHSS